MDMSTVDISKIDQNFAAKEIVYDGIVFREVFEEPFKIYGLCRAYEDRNFKRMPTEIAEQVSPSVLDLHDHTSGGRIRFRTDSSKILLRTIFPGITRMEHMPRSGSTYFDLYLDGDYYDFFRPGQKQDPKNTPGLTVTIYNSNLPLDSKKMRDVEINFPLYNKVDSVFIGLEEDAALEPPKEYTHTKPIVFYGSSITQGGCASHAGNCYTNMLSRRFDADIINLGFSGSALAEPSMIEYVSNLDMGIFVYDYDHNAPTVEHLKNTHEKMFKAIREKHPTLPIIMVSAADRSFGTKPERAAVIRATYENAVKAGDTNVYFVDGSTIYAPVGRDLCTVDSIHPNDTGFYMMAQAIGTVIEQVYQKGDCHEHI